MERKKDTTLKRPFVLKTTLIDNLKKTETKQQYPASTLLTRCQWTWPCCAVQGYMMEEPTVQIVGYNTSCRGGAFIVTYDVTHTIHNAMFPKHSA